MYQMSEKKGVNKMFLNNVYYVAVIYITNKYIDLSKYLL